MLLQLQEARDLFRQNTYKIERGEERRNCRKHSLSVSISPLYFNIFVSSHGLSKTSVIGFKTHPNPVVVKNPPANAEEEIDVGLIPGLGRSLGGGNGTPLQYSCLENPMGRGAWWATIHGFAKSQT